jgi:predicted amidohydrolase YtcJ
MKVVSLAISGERITATGSTANIRKLAGANTKVIDLKGKTVIPGLIDNHFHLIRGAANWTNEARIDLVNTHKEALALISAKAKALGPGKWVFAIGGWSENQFTDKRRGFTKAELDAAAPNNPVFLPRTYGAGYANTLALKAAKIGPDTPNPKRGKIIKGKDGKPTGVIRGFGAIVSFAKNFPKTSGAEWTKNFQAMMTSMNASGLTTVHDIGGRGASPKQYGMAQKLANSQGGKLSLRIFYSHRYPRNKGFDAAIASIKGAPKAQASDYFRRLGIGEGIWSRLNDNVTRPYKIKKGPFKEYKQIVSTAGSRRWPIHTHAMTTKKISYLLDMFKDIDSKINIKPLRWTIAHAYGISAANLKAAKDLGMVVAFHSTPTINGASWKKAIKIKGPLEMPPLKRAQESGIVWGLGTDPNVVAPYLLFQEVNTIALGPKSNAKLIVISTKMLL